MESKKPTTEEIKQTAYTLLICDFVQKIIIEEINEKLTLYDLSSITICIYNLYKELLNTTDEKIDIETFLKKYESIIKELLLDSLGVDQIVYN